MLLFGYNIMCIARSPLTFGMIRKEMNINDWEARASHIFFGEKMFILKDNLKFINVSTNYLKAMHNACPEVFYSTNGYENKPHIGILISENTGICYPAFISKK